MYTVLFKRRLFNFPLKYILSSQICPERRFIRFNFDLHFNITACVEIVIFIHLSTYNRTKKKQHGEITTYKLIIDTP